MGWKVIEFEPTPNPNAIKCHLDRRISSGPLSCRTADEAKAVPIAGRLFDAGATSVLLCDDWVTVNVASRKQWSSMKKTIRDVLGSATETDACAT